MFDRDLDCFADADADAEAAALPIRSVRPNALDTALAALPPAQAAFARASGFAALPGQLTLLPGQDGLDGALLGLGEDRTPFAHGGLPTALPKGAVARLEPGDFDMDGAVLGFCLGNNPFVGKAGVRPEIWSYGHRNVEAAALDAGGRLWEVEMGPRGGDELNRPEAGKDYGWPTIGYGEEYSGLRVGKGLTQAKGMEQPVYYWDPVIAPSGLAIYSGKAIPEWKGNFFIGGLASTALVRLVLRDDRVVGEERLLTERGDRIRDVVEGPDGALYLLTDDSSGKILRVGPAKP